MTFPNGLTIEGEAPISWAIKNNDKFALPGRHLVGELVKDMDPITKNRIKRLLEDPGAYAAVDNLKETISEVGKTNVDISRKQKARFSSK